MAIVVTPPEKVGFSKDKILWRFQDDRAGIIPGIKAESYLTIGSAVPAGSQIIFRWADKDLRFTAVAGTPSEYGNEFPAYPTYSEATKQAYVESLVPYFQKNLFLGRDFDIVADKVVIAGPIGSATLWFLKLTARKAGSTFNLVQTNFSGGTLKRNVVGTDDSTVPNNSVYVEIWMQTADGSIYERKHESILTFDSSSRAEIDVAEILHSNLNAELVDMVLPVAQKCPESRRKYKIAYALYGGAPPSVGPLQETPEFIVLLGGFKQWKSGPESVVNSFKINDTQSRILSLRGFGGNAMRVARRDEPVFVSWVNFGAAGKNIHARATVTFSDGTILDTNTGVVNNVGQHEKLIFGVGFTQLNLAAFGGNRTVSEYTVELRDDLGPVSNQYRVVINYAHLEYVRYFAYVNSFGAIETLMSYGKGSAHWKVFKEQAQRVLPYTFNSSQAQFVEWNTTYQDNQQVATGWVRKKDLALWLDLFISPQKYRVIKGDPYAITIGSDTVQQGTDGQNQHALAFEYQYSRLFDSISEEVREGEDQQDQLPAGAVVAGVIPRQQLPAGLNLNLNYKIDPYPVRGSNAAVSSDGMARALAALQQKLTIGSADEYMDGEHNPRNLRTAVNAVETDPTVPGFAKSLTGPDVIFNHPSMSAAVRAAEQDPTVPDFAKSLTDADVIFNHAGMTDAVRAAEQDPTVPDFAKTLTDADVIFNHAGMADAVRAAEQDPTVPVFAKSLTGIDVIFNALQAMNPGLNVKLFDGHTAEWYIKLMSHPAFNPIPPIQIIKGEPFVKYVDLAKYKTSYHDNDQLSVDVRINSLKMAGLEIENDELLIKLSGQIDQVLEPDENVLLIIKDAAKNQTSISLTISAIEDGTGEPEEPEQPENPDNRPVCPAGPNHWPQSPIEVFDNGHIRVPFDARGVDPLEWVISSDGTANAGSILRQGQSPADGGPFFHANFNPLPGGKVFVGMRGVLCKSNWAWRELVLPDDTDYNFATGYPKHESQGSNSAFLVKIDGSAPLLTELYDITNGSTKLYSATHNYVANETEIAISKVGGWPQNRRYKLNVGTLSAEITLGNPVEPPSITFKLVNGWDGTTVQNLSTGQYNGPVLAGGWNGVLQSSSLGFLYGSAEWKLEIDNGGSWEKVTSVGGSFVVNNGPSGILTGPLRIFQGAGVDSRHVAWNGPPLNRYGKMRITFTFFQGLIGSAVVQSFQQTITFFKLEVKGGVQEHPGAGRFQPVLGRVQLNGKNVINDNVWQNPFETAPRIEYSVDGGSTWNGDVSSWFNMSGTNDTSNLWLLNTGTADRFPLNRTIQVLLRMAALPSVVSNPITVTTGTEPPLNPQGPLELSGYYGRDSSDDVNNDFKVRIAFGTPPYSGTAKNFLDQTIHSFSNVQSDEVGIPNTAMNNLAGGIKVTVADSAGSTKQIVFDNGTLLPLKTALYGFSIADGDDVNHVNKINEGEFRGFTLTGVIFENNNIETDEQLIALENAGPFDHTQPLPSKPVFKYDPVIKTLMSKSTCKFLRFNTWQKRVYRLLNNGTTRTLFVGPEDGMMRPDGTLVTKAQGGEMGQYFDVIIPSYASAKALAFAKRYQTAIVKRYINQINSGNIAAAGIIFTTSGENENTFTYQIGEGQLDYYQGVNRTHGDFHPASVALFKQRFPQYANLSNDEIAFSARESDLNVRWKWHNNQMRIDFNNAVSDHVIANVPQLKRTGWVQIDSGSFIDELAFHRCTLNTMEMVKHPAVFMVKSNDNSNEAAETMQFILNHGTSMARAAGGRGGKFVCEPSPQNYEDPANMAPMTYQIGLAHALGGDISIYTPIGQIASNLKDSSGYTPGAIPRNKQEFQVNNGVKKLLTHSINLSEVLIGGGHGGSGAWKNSLLAFKAANGLTAVNTRSIDNVKPS